MHGKEGRARARRAVPKTVGAFESSCGFDSHTYRQKQ